MNSQDIDQIIDEVLTAELRHQGDGILQTQNPEERTLVLPVYLVSRSNISPRAVDSSSGSSTDPMTLQFLPPQPGTRPKKIFSIMGIGRDTVSHAGLTPSGSGPLDPDSAVPRPAPLAEFMTVDGQMKRTCKQCGQPGRYKDNKCVEKWGPGPQGSETVCGRCRDKIKRIEKRATQDSTRMTTATGHPHQYPLAPAGSFPQLLLQGTDQVIGSYTGVKPSMSGPLDPNSAISRPAPLAGFMTVDGQMKRICKQCGQPGRYKDNKCVEKWGPGPQGPWTVCDRCKKRIKRRETGPRPG